MWGWSVESFKSVETAVRGESVLKLSFFILIYFILFWLCWVFLAEEGFSLLPVKVIEPVSLVSLPTELLRKPVVSRRLL